MLATIPTTSALPIGLGLGSALAWGLGDYAGGVLSRKTNVFGVVTIAYATGFSVMALCAFARHEGMLSGTDAAWAATGGVIGGLALSAFYEGLAIGQMGVVAPIAAVLTAAIPVAYGAIDEGLPRRVQLAGFAIALVSIWMVSRPEPEKGNRNGLLLAVLSGIGFGAYLIFIRKAGTTGVFWPLAIARGSSSLSIFLIFSALRKFSAPDRRHLPMILGAGALDASGIALFLIGAKLGRLDVTAVLSSMYPAVTVVLARVKLNEELRGIQVAGIAAAILAVMMIAI